MPLPPRPAILGVDVGGVIIDRDISLRQSWLFCHSSHYLKIPAVPHALRALAQINQIFNGRVVVISKCNNKTKDRTIEWLNNHNFTASTGIATMVFVPTLNGKAKACLKYGITHFIDNRIAFLQLLHIASKNRLLLSTRGRSWGKLRRPNGSAIKIFTNWPDIVAHLRQQV